ncbi:titin-like isoform X6 [Anopheles albimanus]|uniref:titin-like isoform X6 n=1 Tax=Anopheles albimanus TaxID=7167 RepID=UPI001642105B|nr:titin-like isoform X6 [Anopheles albimanus]
MQRPNPNQPPFQLQPQQQQQQQQLVQQHQQQMRQQSSMVMQQSSTTMQQQHHQQQQQFVSQEFSQQQQQFSSSQQSHISRSEHSVSRQVTQQRVQQQHGGFIQQSTTPLASITPGVQTPIAGGTATPFQQQQQQQPPPQPQPQPQQPSYVAPVSIPAVDYSPPVFEQIFKNSRFAQGGNALFEGKLKGNPRPEVSWTRKGAPLLDSSKHRLSYNPATGAVSLLINQIGPGDEGEYTCKARNAVGEAICSVFIQPEGMPTPQFQQVRREQQQQQTVIKQQQQQQQYTNGYSHIEEEFKVDTFEYRLLRESSYRESITRRYAGETDAQLITTIDRALGPAAAPQISQKPRNSKLVEGSDAVFSTRVVANPRPRLSWFKDGQRIIPSADKYEVSYSNQQATLRIKNAVARDSGHYTLLAENPQGCQVSSAILAIEPAHEQQMTVTERSSVTETQQHQQQQQYIESSTEATKALSPSFVTLIQDAETTEGKMVRFDCRVTGRPYPEVAWYINGNLVTDDATHKILVNEAGNHSLMITSTSRYDHGVVTCVARNKTGEVAAQAKLVVCEREQVVAPKFVERFTTVNVKEGEPVQLFARAIGTPLPRITWQKDGIPLVPGPEVQIFNDDNGSTTVDIPRAKASDAAWYQCTAQNVAGTTATRARLFVETPKGPAPEQKRLNLPRPTKVIQPEAAPEPEIIFLRHVERAAPHLPPKEEERTYPPPKFIVPLSDVAQVEGGKVHFEARIEPVSDPTMRVQWFLNGNLIQASSRANTTFQFGFVALDLLTIVMEDSGEYLCRLSSSTGVAESRAMLSVQPRPPIEQQTQHPSTLNQIQQLEDYSKYVRTESIEEVVNQRPAFTRPLQDLGELEEGRNAHFEAQITPVSDPTMRVEWYKDGRPITASSRITAIFNFGYVSLNIMHLRAEDAGTYTVRAVNRIGEAISTSKITVVSKAPVTGDLGISEQRNYIQKIEELEQYQKYQNMKFYEETPESTQRPEFKSPITDQLNVREGGFAHFEARLEPVGDATLRVEWLKDGHPVEASSRITSFCNFGYVALTIKQVTVHDVGNYTCRAYNSLGEAHVTARLTVVTRQDIIVDSQTSHMGMEKIQYLEDSSRYTRTTQQEIEQQQFVQQQPRFLGPLKGTNRIVEGQRGHFEARLEPQSDLTMRVEWYHNGRPLMSANRIQTYHDFGYVALDILDVRAEDSGTYTLVAVNSAGQAQVEATMVVETRAAIDTTSMHHVVERSHQQAEKQFVEPQYQIEELCKSKPIFTQPLSDPQPVGEGRNIHLECKLEPLGDPTMRVEWYQNGRPITVGSRFKTYYDFGFVALDILHSTALDSGEYTVRATNQLGSAHTSACVRVITRSDVITEAQSEMSVEQMQYLEDASRMRRDVLEDITVMSAPQFARSLHNIETYEGTNIHLECRLQPVGDPSMRVEWFVNGMPVKIGHRFRPAFEFDYVALDLLGVYAADSGVYTCQARNSLGEAVTSCSVRIMAKKDLILETQYPAGLEKLQYLEDIARYRKTEYVDEIVNVKPRFLTKPKNIERAQEGGHAHFECKLEPVTDPNLKVEWYKNGMPITVGHRFRPIHDFGYVALDIVDLIAEDTGTYMCRAVNLVGVDEIAVQLTCRGSQQILTNTQNEMGLEQIQYLEEKTRQQRSEYLDEMTTQAPTFTTSLKHIEIKEGQRAHFECRLIPVSDPTLRVEWYHNEAPVKTGSRFTETNNFGFVALDIMGCLADDSGTYTCRAVNALGEAVTSATCVVHTRKNIYSETQHEHALTSLRYLEDNSRYQRETEVDEVITQAPVFTLPVKDVKVAENQAVHFEARLVPVGDAKMRVEWLRNGVPIEASNRITTMHDFGYVALNMKYVNPEDSGTYTCRATNDLGQAVTSAKLVVQSKASLDLETQNESALEKIHQLEDAIRFQRREEEDVEVTQPPRFTTKLLGPTNLVEGQSAHYECRIEPYPDPSLRVEWFHNGQPLTMGHRFRTTYDFGFAALDVLTVYAEDSGEYTCRATNHLGTETSSVKLTVTPKAGIVRETQHEGALEKIQYLECDARYGRKGEDELYVAEKPQFGRPLKNACVTEGLPVHLEATLTPVNDPTMKVEWYCNGRPIQQGHRFKTTYDFGFVALDILYAHAEDTGTYMCKAKNAIGEAVTTCAVKVTANAGLYLETLDEQRLQKIKELESYQKPQTPEVEPAKQKPVFLTPLTSLENLKEGDYAHLECRVEPINDPNLKIEWYINGKAIRAGHRFRTTHDFGYVALDILYVYGEDSGTYMCKATNQVGEAVSTCNIRVTNKRNIIFDSQHPDGLEKIQKLEAHVRPSRLELDEPEVTAPRFVTELRGTTEIHEGQTAHFEAQVEPIHDPNLRIEFYHNGKALQSASRFHITFDFGYVALDIQHVVAEDAGEYTVKAINAKGQCKSSIKMQVTAKGSIISETQHPEGLDKIKQLEGVSPFRRPEVQDAVTRQRPVFTQPLQNIDFIAEGQTAHFECRLIPVGDPNLKVEWFRNEKPLEDSSRISKQHDFGFVSMDLQHVREEDEGVYMCRAINPLGEAVTTASMRIRTKASIQMDSQHPEGMKKIIALEQPHQQRAEDAEAAFEKPIFTQLLTGPSELWEGQHAHFEARVVPVGDASMKYEWYVNGVELKMGSRFRTTNDFGFVTLDINSTVAEDSGVYMCKAINKAGEAVSSTTMKIKSKASIAGEPLLPEAWEKIQLKEAAMNRVPDMFVDTTPQQAPVFTTHLESHDKLQEGQHVYLEAQVEPRADPNLRIEWFKNGIAITTGARIRSTFDFGLVTLSINGLRADDSAIYTCKATNNLGEAVSTATLKIDASHWLLGDTMHPSSVQKIQDLEAPRINLRDLPEAQFESPVFVSHLNNVDIKEGENAHFECNVEPSKDPTMQIEWFVNGKPLPTGARFKTTYDFGFVSLDISGAYAEDSGIYTCKATNSKGSASTSGSLRCTSTTTMYLDTQHPQGKAGLEAVQDTEAALANRYRREDGKPETTYPKPQWTVQLQQEFRLNEAESLHLEGTVEPKDDPNLKIEWYFNGKVLQHGSRFKMTSDFGFVTLDLTEVYERDQGIYTCKAYNLAGEAFTSSTVYCVTKESLIERTQHPKGTEGLEKIQDLEDSLRRQQGAPADSDAGHAPRFTSEFIAISNIGEGEIAHFDATLIPTGDQTMNIEWFYNGKQLDASHRVRTVYAFGMVVLEILGTKIEDTGSYTCRATNKWGTAEISVQLECVEKPAGQKPRFTTHIQNLEGLKDGQSAHFECTLVPVNDPDLKVEWFHNGKPLRHSTRIKPVSDFGYVLLDIAYVQSHDSGEYVCRASNKYGEDSTRATLKCFGKGGVYLESLQPDSLARIRELESQAGAKQTAAGSPVGEAPRFTTKISDITKLVEGQSAHFEARLTPINDPELVVEWYWNGQKLPHGHRYRTFHDFGIVILDILYCYEENSGEFECRATNKYGSDSTKATLKCVSKANLILDSQLPRGMEGGLEKIQTLEDSLVRTRDERERVEGGRAPVFTTPLSNIDSLREGESAHFEAKLTPTDDPKLKVEWFWNGKPLKTGSRFRTFCDFGFVILEISPVYPEDSGEYSCRATNEYGEAVTTSTMKVQGKRSIILESQLPKGMEGTIERIAELEGLGIPHGGLGSPDDDTGKPPEFITTPSDMTLTENSLAHFECRLTPINDPSMRVEWYHNGKALWAGSRIKTINDFGFVILEIAGCYQRDSGLYTCKATNRHGEATVSCKLTVRGRQGIIMEPQLPSNFRTGTESIQKLEEQLHKREELLADEEEGRPPKFVVDIKDNVDVPEGGPVHFDCRVEPVGDSSLRIDWFHNGKPFATGSRVHMLNDFGFIALDMDYAYVRDSGVYECRATNKWGTASTTAKVTVVSRGGIVLDSQLPEGMTASKLKELERGKVTLATQEERTFGPPKFVSQIQSATIDEGETIRFECRVEPKEDPKLRVEWFRNGKPLPSGHRYRTIYDMGFVSLDILSVYTEDAGDYTCRAYNEHGEDMTKAHISCKKLPSIVLQNQIPKGMQKSETLMQMEATIKKYTEEIFLTEDDLFDPDRKQPPRFVTQIKDQINLVEMQATKFECQLAPVGDPDMKVEWFYNGKPLPYKNRFTPIYDFGYVAMNFGWIYPEDSGEYLCRATNLYGMDETRAVIKTTGKPGIVYDSQLPKGMKSIQKIREMEALWNLNIPEVIDETQKPKKEPAFVSRPESIEVEEGEWARFCCRVTGHPKPRVMWLINGHTVVNGQRYKLTYDGMYHFDIPKTRQYDTGKIEVIARSSVGEAHASCELKITPRRDDYRGVLKNSPRPWYDYDLVAYQKGRNENDLEVTLQEEKAKKKRVTKVTQKAKAKKEGETEWQKTVKKKKGEEYYNKLAELETEQITKEQKMREEKHQFAIPGEKVVSQSIAKGMASAYEQTLEETKIAENVELIEAPKAKLIPEPTETSVQGKEVHVSQQKQTQKEVYDDKEIIRKITATETTEMEHKGTTQERVVEGPVQPTKPPVFTKKIQPCRVFENEQARFEVEFDGEPMPTVKWFRENFQINNSSDFQIHTFGTKSVLIIRQVFLEDSAVFAVIAENRGGTAKCSANLVVEQRRQQGRGGIIPPSFVSTITDTTVTAGQLARFDAKVTGTKPLDVYWLKNGQKIAPNIKYKTLEEDNNYTLLIIEAYAEDGAKYECVAINSAGEARCDAVCNVDTPVTPIIEKPATPGTERPPTLVEPLKDKTVPEGQSVEFRTRVTGKPNPTAQWFKGDKQIKPSKYFQMAKDRDTFTLIVTEAFPEDEGQYLCIVSNPGGEVHTTATLKVVAPEMQDAVPKLSEMKDCIVDEGSPAQFKTTIVGKSSKMTVQWLREGLLIPESPDFQMINEGSNAVLLIGTTYEEDSGLFTCRVTTSAGQVETSAKLIVKKRRKQLRQVFTADGTQIQDQQTVTQQTQKHASAGVSSVSVHGEADVSYDSSTSQSEVDTEYVPQGDDNLPWRRSRSSSRGPAAAPWRRPSQDRRTSRDRSLSIDRREEVKPWTAEVVKLKKTTKERKTIEKEKIESVQLKPTQIQKPQIKREQIEKVDLKAVKREQQEISEQHMEEMVEAIISEKATTDQIDYNVQKLRHDEDISILEITQHVDELIRKDSLKEQGVAWRRGPKGRQEFVETDESALLKVKHEESTLELEKQQQTTLDQTAGVAWRRGNKPGKPEKPELQPFTQVEDTTISSVDRSEEQEEKHQESKAVPWRRGPKTETQSGQFCEQEDTSKLLVEHDSEQTETKPIEQPVPWRRGRPKEQKATEQVSEKETPEAQLPPWMRGRKPGPKRELPKPPEPEKIPQVSLKPTPRQKKEIAKETIEEVSLKPVPKRTVVQEQVPEEPEVVEEQRTKPKKPVDLTPKEQLEQLEKIDVEPRDKPQVEEKLGVESVEVAEPLAKATTPEQPSWRRSKKPKPEEPQSEEKQWPTGKRRPLPEEAKEEVILKPIPKPSVAPKPEPAEELSIRDVSGIPPIAEPGEEVAAVEEKQDKEATLPPWRRGKKPVTKREIPAPAEPERVEQISLKPTPRQKKELAKESVEEVMLKPVPKKPITEDVPAVVAEEAEKGTVKITKKKNEKPTPSKPEPMEPLEFTPTEMPVVEKTELEPLDVEKVPQEPELVDQQAGWRRQARPKEKETIPEEKEWPKGKRRPLPEESKEEVVLKPIPKPSKEDEPEPTQDTRIHTKPLPALSDEPERDDVPVVPQVPTAEPLALEEDSNLPPWRRGKKPIQKKELPKLPEPETVEKVELKSTRREKKEIPKESIEEVLLKPVAKQPVQEEVTIATEPETEQASVVIKKVKKHKPKPAVVALEKPEIEPAEEQEVEQVCSEPEVIVERLPESPSDEPEKDRWIRSKKPKPDQPEEETKQWPTGKRRPLPEEPKEEVTLKPIPKPSVEPTLKAPKEPSLAPIKSPEVVSLPTEPAAVVELDESHLPPWHRGRKDKPKREIPQPEPEVMETVTLKPTPKRGKELPQETLEEVSLKPVPQQTQEELLPADKVQLATIKEITPRKVKKPVRKEEIGPPEKQSYPEIPDADDVQLEQAETTPIETVKPAEVTPEKPSWRRTPKPKPVENEPEEKQWPTGKRRPPVEEPKEEVVLKPIPRPEKQLEPKPELEAMIKPKPTENLPEQEPQPTPWRRTKPKKPTVEPEEPKEWPKGKQRPLEEAPKEEVALKPIPKPVEDVVPQPADAPELKQPTPMPSEPEQPKAAPWHRGKKEMPKTEQAPREEVTLKPVPKPLAPEETVVEEVVLKPVPAQEAIIEEVSPVHVLQPVKIVQEEVEITTKTKRVKKQIIRPKFPVPGISEVEESVTFEEPEEPAQVAETIVDIVPEEVLDLIPEQTPREVAKKRKSRNKKHVVFKEELSTFAMEPEENEEEEEEEEQLQEVSTSSIVLSRPPSESKPEPARELPKSEVVVEEQTEFRKEMEVKVQSNIVKKEKKRRVFIDDSQPLPELEIITQKRVQEVTDKVAEEEVREERQLLETTQQRIAETKIEERTIKMVKPKVQPPNIIEKLQPRICEPNKPVQLRCRIEGIPFPDVQWYFNDTLLFANPEYCMNVVEDVATLEIATVQPYHVGIYTCEAKNVAGVAISKANIIVQEKEEPGEAPRFVVPLKIELNEPKTVATVTCQVAGIPTPKVRWLRDDVELIEEEEIETFYEERTGRVRLTVKRPQQNHPVVYTVIAENKFGKAVGKANVFIQAIVLERALPQAVAPQIVQPLEAQVLRTGSTLVFECKYTGLPKPTVKWFRNSKEIIEEEEEEITIITKEYYSRLEIRKVTRQRGGKYEITVTNEAGQAKSSASVSISDATDTDEAKAPRFIEPLVPKLIAEAEVCILEASVDSYPTSTFQWFREGTAISSTNEQRIVTTDNRSILIIESFTRKDTGAYTCRAENVAGSVTSTATVQTLDTIETEEVTEYISPRFLETIKPTRVMDGEKLTLECQVVAKPLPKVHWYHNMQLIRETKDKQVHQDSTGRCQLTISEVFPEDKGEYTCVAANKIGEAICRATVNVEPFEYVPDSEQFRSSEEDLLTDKSISTLEEYAEPFECAPQIVKQLPTVIHSQERELTKLEVKVHAHPKPQIRWLKAGEEIIPSDEFQIENFDDGTSILIINDIYPDDSGEITFEAHNALGVAMTTTELVVEEIVGTKAYRKPEWVQHMEEMKEALQASYSTPSYSVEIKDSRAMLGEKGFFECHYAGNPKPDILWYRNGKIVIANDRTKIRTSETSSTLTIYPVEVSDFGFYKCKAMNEAGTCESIAKLIESLVPTLTDDEKAELEATRSAKRGSRANIKNGKAIEKVELVVEESEEVRREKAEKRKKRGEIRKQKESQLIEELVKQELEASLQEKIKFSSESTTTLTTSTTSELTQDVKLSKDRATVKFKEHTETLVEEIVTTETVQEIERMVIHEKLDVSDVDSVKNSLEVNEILINLKASEFGPGEAPLRELATIAFMVKHGVTVSEITSFYQANHFPALQKPESQSAMVLLLEREGYANIVTEILTETDMDETQLAATAGFRAFMRMIEVNHASVEEIIAHFSPDDFVVQEWKTETAYEKHEESRLISSTEVRTTETTVRTMKELDIKGLKS